MEEEPEEDVEEEEEADVSDETEEDLDLGGRRVSCAGEQQDAIDEWLVRFLVTCGLTLLVLDSECFRFRDSSLGFRLMGASLGVS